MKYYYCFSSNGNLFKEEIEYAKKNDVYICYDYVQDIFLDEDNNEVDIRGMLIFPRSTINNSIKLLDAIKRHGGNSLIKEDDYLKTLNWPYYVRTKRNNIILSGSEIVTNPQFIIEVFGSDKIFLKTKNKNFSGVIEVSKILDENSSVYLSLIEHLDDDFIVSDAVIINSDEYGLLEYRIFVVEEEIFNISRIGNDLISNVPNEVISSLKNIINELKGTDFPKSYVIDLFEYTDFSGKKVIDVLECNPIIASGTYLYNSIFEKNTDLEHKSLIEAIPRDKIGYSNGYVYGCDVKKDSKPSVFYNVPGSFAADLVSYSLFGTRSKDRTYFNDDIYNSSRSESTPRLKCLSRVREEICSKR